MKMMARMAWLLRSFNSISPCRPRVFLFSATLELVVRSSQKPVGFSCATQCHNGGRGELGCLVEFFEFDCATYLFCSKFFFVVDCSFVIRSVPFKPANLVIRIGCHNPYFLDGIAPLFSLENSRRITISSLSRHLLSRELTVFSFKSSSALISR